MIKEEKIWSHLLEYMNDEFLLKQKTDSSFQKLKAYGG